MTALWVSGLCLAQLVIIFSVNLNVYKKAHKNGYGFSIYLHPNYHLIPCMNVHISANKLHLNVHINVHKVFK